MIMMLMVCLQGLGWSNVLAEVQQIIDQQCKPVQAVHVYDSLCHTSCIMGSCNQLHQTLSGTGWIWRVLLLVFVFVALVTADTALLANQASQHKVAG